MAENIKILTNTAADEMTGVTITSGTPSVDANDVRNCVAPPRSRLVWFDAATASAAFIYRSANYSSVSADITVDHCVITRLDRYKTNAANWRVRVNYYNGSHTADIDENPFSSFTDLNNMQGPYAQDYCFELTSGAFSAWGVEIEPLNAQSYKKLFNCVCLSQAFDIGSNPTLVGGATWRRLPDGFRFRPQKGYYDYECEAQLSLFWEHVTDAKVTAFLALPQILKWPMFLYDKDQVLWDYKLEHVLLQDYQIVRIGPGLNNVTMTFLRMKHFERTVP